MEKYKGNSNTDIWQCITIVIDKLLQNDGINKTQNAKRKRMDSWLQILGRTCSLQNQNHV